MPDRAPHAVLVEVSGPISWSYYWPRSDTAHTLKRAAYALSRLSAAEAPFGVYQVTVDGTTREVVRSSSK